MKRLLLILLIVAIVSVSALAVLEQAEIIDVDSILSHLLPQEIKAEMDSAHFKDPLKALTFRAKNLEKQQDVSEE